MWKSLAVNIQQSETAGCLNDVNTYSTYYKRKSVCPMGERSVFIDSHISQSLALTHSLTHSAIYSNTEVNTEITLGIYIYIYAGIYLYYYNYFLMRKKINTEEKVSLVLTCFNLSTLAD